MSRGLVEIRNSPTLVVRRGRHGEVKLGGYHRLDVIIRPCSDCVDRGYIVLRYATSRDSFGARREPKLGAAKGVGGQLLLQVLYLLQDHLLPSGTNKKSSLKWRLKNNFIIF